MFNVRKATIIVLIFLAVLALGLFAVAGDSLSSSGLSTKSLNNATQCWQFASSNSCTSSGNGTCIWNSDQWGSWCASATCYYGDNTNYTYCQETLRNSYNLSCGWQIYNTNLCDPNGTTSSFIGQGCSDYNGNQQGCYNTLFCQWNSSNNGCMDPAGFADNYVPVQGPGCGAVVDQPTCKNITSCSWNAGSSTCTGFQSGMQCNNLNKTICSDFTMLSTCCNWNGTNCKSTFDTGCYDSMPALSAGKMFCEDSLTYNNQTNCNEIAGPPWYMPCKWDNDSDECHFNSVSFGGSASFDEIGTKIGCEAQNGIWKVEQFTQGNVTQTDSWCEFKFGFEYGGGGNCDSACWSCETGISASGGDTVVQAENSCENSSLGFCEFDPDSNAPNGLGWCNPKSEFVQGGGKSCDDECGACDYMLNPSFQCQDNIDCVWAADVNAPNGAGFCYGKNEKRCENDCWNCYTFNDCAVDGDGGDGACVWDSVNSFCKPSGFTGEVCFDGKDNDADNNVDCADSECSTDKFCGGDDLDLGFGVSCPSFSSNASCKDNGCVWLVDNFDANFVSGNSSLNSSLIGFCDFPGAQCWQNDDNSSACNATSGCGWLVQSSGFCTENSTLFDRCFLMSNLSTCLNIPGCEWVTDSFGAGSRCEPLVFAECFGNSTRRLNQTNCEQNETHVGASTQICSWSADSYNPNGGFCDPVCFDLSASTCNAKSSGLCEVVSGLCEPTSFGGNCFSADGNQTKCIHNFNTTCSWFTDAAAGNNVSNGTVGMGVTPSGWCDPKGAGGYVEFMGTIEPVIIGIDEIEVINQSYNIIGVGLRDEFDKIVFGTRTLDSFANSSACNNVPVYSGLLGAGVLDYTFHWYVDADGNSSNNCAARDNSSLAGFEFMFKYQDRWVTSLTEVQTASRCINGSWGAAPIPLISSKQIMCDVVGGGMAGVGKAELYKFKGLYNKSKDLRIYATVSNITNNDSRITDAAGPFFYTQGSIDSTFEDCTNAGADSDGDGLTATNDPDCQMFLKFGYTPIESGFMCGDGKDNDGDGNADCADVGCKYDFVCGGSGLSEADPNDKTAPKIIWMKADTYPDSAFIVYDTDEPSNGTVLFYNNDSSCKTINKTVRDSGLLENQSLVSAYKLWHDSPINGYTNNVDAIVTPLKNSTVFFYKTKVCDINSNCAVSACLNFSTKKTIGDCKGCKSTLNFPFTPPPGSIGERVTYPIGNLHFVVEKSDGTNLTLAANAAAGIQLNYTDAKNFNLLLENPDVANTTRWRFRLLNASITGKISASALNFSGGSDLQFNATTNGSYVGLDATKCQELLNSFRPKKLEIGIPGNYTTELWQCNSGLANCTNKASNATSLGYNSELKMSLWVVPAGWGC